MVTGGWPLGGAGALKALVALPLVGMLAVRGLAGRRGGPAVGAAVAAVGGVGAALLSWLTWRSGSLSLGPWTWIAVPGTGMDWQAALVVDVSAALMLTLLSGLVLVMHLHVLETPGVGDLQSRSRVLGAIHMAWLGTLLVVCGQGVAVLLLGWGVGAMALMELMAVDGRRALPRRQRLMLAVARFGDGALVGGVVLLAVSGAGHPWSVVGPALAKGGWGGGCVLLGFSALARCSQVPCHWRGRVTQQSSGGVSTLAWLLLPGISGVYVLLRGLPPRTLAAGFCWPLGALVGASSGIMLLLILASRRLDQAVAYTVALHLGVALLAALAGTEAVAAYHLLVMLPALGAALTAARGVRRNPLFLLAVLLLAGVMPVGGSWSLMLLAAWAGANGVSVWAAVVAAALATGLVGGHLLVLAEAERRTATAPLRPSPVMLAPILLLLLAIVAGPAGYLLGSVRIGSLLLPMPADVGSWALPAVPPGAGLAVPLLASVVGGAVAILRGRFRVPETLAGAGVPGRGAGPLAWSPERCLDHFLVRPAVALARTLEHGVEVMGLGVWVAMGLGLGTRALGLAVGALHTGKVRHGLLGAVLGTICVVCYFALTG